MNEQRKAFEAWFGPLFGNDFAPLGDSDQYGSMHTQGKWHAWQAAIASQAPRQALTDAASDVLTERQRQIEVEEWTEARDDQYDKGQLGRAAACYALHTEPVGNVGDYLRFWPWHATWWKPSDKRRNMVKAAALILAEIERIDRAALAAVGVEP